MKTSNVNINARVRTQSAIKPKDRDQSRTRQWMTQGNEMDSSDEERVTKERSLLCMKREMKAKLAELDKVKEEIKRAKDSASQSWLDSRPAIDELERLQVALEGARRRAEETDAVVSELLAELEAVHAEIRGKNEQGREAKRMISETNQTLDHTREDMEQLKLETDEEKRGRAKLKQDARLKRQELRKLQLMLRAIRIETEAYAASESAALQHVNRLETENNTVQLTSEDYNSLRKRAKEETSLGDWRISVSVEQRLLAEATREAAMKRLKELYSEQQMKTKVAEVEEVPEDDKVRDEEIPEEDDDNVSQSTNPVLGSRSRSTRAGRKDASSRRTESSEGSNWEQHQRTRDSSRRRVPKKKKPSIFHKIRLCFVLKIAGLFIKRK